MTTVILLALASNQVSAAPASDHVGQPLCLPVAMMSDTCNWRVDADTTGWSGPTMSKIPGGGPWSGPQHLYANVNYQSWVTVEGPANNTLPGDGPPSEPTCPQWPTLVDREPDDYTANHSFIDDIVIGSTQVYEAHDNRTIWFGYGRMEYIPTGNKYTRTLSGVTWFGHAEFVDVSPGGGGGGDPG